MASTSLPTPASTSKTFDDYLKAFIAFRIQKIMELDEGDSREIRRRKKTAKNVQEQFAKGQEINLPMIDKYHPHLTWKDVLRVARDEHYEMACQDRFNLVCKVFGNLKKDSGIILEGVYNKLASLMQRCYEGSGTPLEDRQEQFYEEFLGVLKTCESDIMVNWINSTPLDEEIKHRFLKMLEDLSYRFSSYYKSSVIVKLKESPASKSISKTKSSKRKDKDAVMVEHSALQIQDKTKEVPTSLITQPLTQEGKSLAGTPKSGGSNRGTPTQDNQTTTTPSAISKVFPQGTISTNHQPQPKSIRGETITKTQDDQRTSAISKVFPQGTISKNQ